MKKIILLIALFAGITTAKAQVATSALQTQGNNTLTVIKQKLDTANQISRSNNVHLGTMDNNLSYINTHQGVIEIYTGQTKVKLDTVNQNLRSINSKETTALTYLGNISSESNYIENRIATTNGYLAGTLTVTPAAGSVYTTSISNTPTVVLYNNYSNFVKGTTASITTTTTTDVLAAPGTSLYNYITDILVTNASSSIGTYVKIIEETSGTILWRGYAASSGGGFSCTGFTTPLKLSTANKKVQVVCETAGADVTVNISGFKGL